jgi:hypothetical protein
MQLVLEPILVYLVVRCCRCWDPFRACRSGPRTSPLTFYLCLTHLDYGLYPSWDDPPPRTAGHKRSHDYDPVDDFLGDVKKRRLAPSYTGGESPWRQVRPELPSQTLTPFVYLLHRDGEYTELPRLALQPQSGAGKPHNRQRTRIAAPLSRRSRRPQLPQLDSYPLHFPLVLTLPAQHSWAIRGSFPGSATRTAIQSHFSVSRYSDARGTSSRQCILARPRQGHC